MQFRGFAMSAAAGAALLLLAACGGDDSTEKSTPSPVATAQGSASAAATPTAGRPAELKEVKLGFTPILINAPFYVGIEKGYFADEGINLKLELPGGSGADILTQVIAGNLQIGSSGVAAALFNAASAALVAKKDMPFEVVSPLHVERPPSNTPLVASKARMEAGEITKVSDLKGKKIAVNGLGTGTEFWLNLALKTGGLTTRDVTIQVLPFANMAEALANKGIDAAMLPEPFATQGADQGLVKVLSNTFVNGEASTAIYWNRDWAKKNPQLADGFLRAFQKAANELEKGGWDNPAIVEILVKYTKVQADVIKRAPRPHFLPDGKLIHAEWRASETYFRAQGHLTYEGNLDLNLFMRLK